MAGVKEMAFWPELLESSTCHTLYPLEQEMQNQRNGSFNRNSVRKKRHSKIRYHTYTHTHRHSSESCLVEHASLQGWPDFIQGNSYERSIGSMIQNAEAVACSRSRIVDCHRTLVTWHQPKTFGSLENSSGFFQNCGEFLAAIFKLFFQVWDQFFIFCRQICSSVVIHLCVNADLNHGWCYHDSHGEPLSEAG